MTLADRGLAKDMEMLMSQIGHQVEYVKHHGYGRVELIICGSHVTTVHAQKTWVRKGSQNSRPY